MTALDQSQYTPLHAAAEGGCSQVIKVLVEKGASVDAVAQKLWTPLAIAVSKATSRHSLPLTYFQLTIPLGIDLGQCSGSREVALWQVLAHQHGTRIALQILTILLMLCMGQLCSCAFKATRRIRA